MKLTKKAQAKFEKYFLSLPDTKSADDRLKMLIGNMWVRFDRLPEAMQWGIFQLFADSEGYDLCASQYDLTLFGWELFKGNTMIDEGFAFKTRPEAWKAAIEKLNEILNEK